MSAEEAGPLAVFIGQDWAVETGMNSAELCRSFQEYF